MQRHAPSWSTLALAPLNLNTSHPVQIFAGALACLKEDSEGREGQDSISVNKIHQVTLFWKDLWKVPHSASQQGGPNLLLSCYRSVSESM